MGDALRFGQHPLLVLEQKLGFFALMNVGQRARHTDGLPLLIPKRLGAGKKPTVVAGFGAQTVFGTIGGAQLKMLLHFLYGCQQIVGM